MFSEDTIAAVATAVGEGGIAIIRLSGPDAIAIGDKLFRSANKAVNCQQSHTAVYGHIVDPDTEAVVDEVLLLLMRQPRSYTREDVVEIHCHGGPLPLRQILALALKAGARLAEPGEFTKRAFLNGRLDLSQAEAVIDIIRAKTDRSLRMAMGHLAGTFSQKIHDFRKELLSLIAQLEASIDFPDEDVSTMSLQDIAMVITRLAGEVDKLLATAQTGRILRDGLKTVIIGKPNVGKSSLMNILLGENRAIVTDVPGTTRDIIEDYLNIGGIPLKIIDTAGIRDTADVVERIGVEKTREVMAQADVILLLLDASSPLTAEDRAVLAMLAGQQTIVLINKTDLPVVIEQSAVEAAAPGKTIIRISALEGTGVETLEQAIEGLVFSGSVTQGEGEFVNNVRQSHLLALTRVSLVDASSAVAAGLPSDCLLVDLRAAWERLGEINGETVSEDIIDQIFTQFCIGK